MNRTGRRAHYVPHNAVTRVPRSFVYLDSEAHNHATRTGTLQTFRCAVAAHDARHHHRDGWKDREWLQTLDPRELWEWVDGRTSPKSRTVLVAHNLSYDARICDAFGILPALGWDLKWVQLDGKTTTATWTRDGRTLSMVDSLSWVPLPLDRIGALVDMRKFQLPAWRDTDQAWLARCRRDVEILGEAWRRLMSFVRDDDMGNWKPSGSGQAWAAYRHQHLTHAVLVHEDDDAREAERDAAWAGRAEAWTHGRARGGPFTEWDYSSAYARIGAECEIPVKLIGGTERATLAQYEKATRRYAVLARCHVSCDTPTTPARIDGRVCWPIGEFESVLWENEIELARAHGARVQVDRMWWYKREPALASFCQWVLATIDPTNTATDPVVAACVKHWGRSLVGRFGARFSTWAECGEAPWTDVALGRVFDASTGERYELLHVGRSLRRRTAVEDGPDAVPSVMSWVMAECRVRLWRVMQAAGLSNVVYVDTDAVIVNAAGHDRLLRAAVPGLRVKGQWNAVTVHGPRQIELGGELRASGVPRRSVKVAPDRWEGEVWADMSRSLSVGEADAVRITPRSFTVRGIDRRRTHNDDGTTSARVVQLGGEVERAS